MWRGATLLGMVRLLGSRHTVAFRGRPGYVMVCPIPEKGDTP